MKRLHGTARAGAAARDWGHLVFVVGLIAFAGYASVDRRDFVVGAALGLIAGSVVVYTVVRRWGRVVGLGINLDRWGPVEQAAFLAEIHPAADALVEAGHAEYLGRISGEHPVVVEPSDGEAADPVFSFDTETWS